MFSQRNYGFSKDIKNVHIKKDLLFFVYIASPAFMYQRLIICYFVATSKQACCRCPGKRQSFCSNHVSLSADPI